MEIFDFFEILLKFLYQNMDQKKNQKNNSNNQQTYKEIFCKTKKWNFVLYNCILSQKRKKIPNRFISINGCKEVNKIQQKRKILSICCFLVPFRKNPIRNFSGNNLLSMTSSFTYFQSGKICRKSREKFPLSYRLSRWNPEFDNSYNRVENYKTESDNLNSINNEKKNQLKTVLFLKIYAKIDARVNLLIYFNGLFRGLLNVLEKKYRPISIVARAKHLGTKYIDKEKADNKPNIKDGEFPKDPILKRLTGGPLSKNSEKEFDQLKGFSKTITLRKRYPILTNVSICFKTIFLKST